MTDDIVLLEAISKKMDNVVLEMRDMGTTQASMDKRLKKVERRDRFGRLIERGLLALITTLLSYQNIKNPNPVSVEQTREIVREQAECKGPEPTWLRTSTRAKGH